MNILILIYSVFPPNHTKPICMHMLCCGCSVVSPWSVDHLTPLSMGFSRQEYWSGLPFPSPEDLSNSGIQPRSPALQVDSLLPSHLGNPNTHKTPQSPCESMSPERSSPSPTPQVIHTVKMSVHSYTYKRKQMFFQSNQPYFLNILLKFFFYLIYPCSILNSTI